MHPALPAGLGIVVGLEAEAVLARRLVPASMVGISGATPEGAARAAASLADRGARALLSFGLAAGLDPSLRPGAILLPDAVMIGDERLAVDATFHRALVSMLGGDTGPLLHSDRLVYDVASKRALFEATGCRGLDMESGHVIRLCEANALPCAILRVVCDPAGRRLPHAARIPLRADGSLRKWRIARAIVSRPGELPELIRLGRDVATAKQILDRCVQVLSSATAPRQPSSARTS